MECIVHYKNQTTYSKLKKLTETNIEKIRKAREKRQQIGGLHCHPQVDLIPDEIDPERHGVHLEPCYKRYFFAFINYR